MRHMTKAFEFEQLARILRTKLDRRVPGCGAWMRLIQTSATLSGRIRMSSAALHSDW